MASFKGMYDYVDDNIKYYRKPQNKSTSIRYRNSMFVFFVSIYEYLKFMVFDK